MAFKGTKFHAQRRRTLLALVAVPACMVVSACAGVQTGDGNRPGCALEKTPLLNLTSLPEGFEQSPLEMLAPVTSGIEGTLTLTTGMKVPLTLEFDLKPEDALQIHRKSTADVSECEARGVEVRAAVAIDGGDVISGEATATIYVLDEQIRIRFDEPKLSTTLSRNSDAQNTTFMMGVQLDTTCRWSGAWAWSAPSDCKIESDECAGPPRSEEPVGNFEAKGSCLK